MNIIIEFIKYRILAKRRHGVHSPFVYKLQDESFLKKFSPCFITDYKELKSNLYNEHRKIEITRYGAGSKITKASSRKISQIAKSSSTSFKYGQLIFRIGEHVKATNALELGTNLGLGSAYISQITNLNKLITIEGCPQLYEESKRNLSKINTTCEIELVNSSFKNYLVNSIETFDLIFIDGDHSSKALLEILDLLEDKTHDNSMIIIDDIRWSNDMFKAWEKIKVNKNFHLTMDFFRMGVIAKRKTQEKEHFILKK